MKYETSELSLQKKIPSIVVALLYRLQTEIVTHSKGAGSTGDANFILSPVQIAESVEFTYFCLPLLSEYRAP